MSLAGGERQADWKDSSLMLNLGRIIPKPLETSTGKENNSWLIHYQENGIFNNFYFHNDYNKKFLSSLWK